MIIEYVDRELSYGKAGRQGRIANKGRLRNLQARRERFPELRSIYDAKIADIEEFSANSISQETVAAHERIVEERLGELDALLGQQTWIAGETYSLADAVWTVGLGRLVLFELEPTTGRGSEDDSERRDDLAPRGWPADVPPPERFSLPADCPRSGFVARAQMGGPT